MEDNYHEKQKNRQKTFVKQINDFPNPKMIKLP